MISFKEYESAGDAVREILRECPSADAEYVAEVADSFMEMSEYDIETAMCTECGCLLVRIFDMGRYSFVYPIEISDEADASLAIGSIRDYAVWQEIPLVICDVPSECLGTLIPGFRHVSVDAADAERASYTVSVISELALADGDITVSDGNITLATATEKYTREYAALCRDEEVNRYWGYDFREDVGDGAPDSYFIGEAIAERARACSLTLFACDAEGFFADVTYHAFDLTGCAEISFRIVRDRHGRGLGRALMPLIFDGARALGLTHLRARAVKENYRSVNLLSHFMDRVKDEETHTVFELML